MTSYWSIMRQYYQKREELSGCGNHLLVPSGYRESLVIAPAKHGVFSGAKITEAITFVSAEDDVTRICNGLEYTIESFLTPKENRWISTFDPGVRSIPAILFDNHNHALYFWEKARVA